MGTPIRYVTDWSAYRSSRATATYYRSYQGSLTPDYYVKAQMGTLPFNAYSVHYTWIRKDVPRFSWSIEHVLGWKSIYQSSSTAEYGFSPLQMGLDNQVTQAKNKAVLRLGEQLSAVRFNAAQFLGERKQTANLMASTASRVYHAARSLRRADLQGFTRALSLSGTETRSIKSAWKRVERTAPTKRISSHWLEFVYGWQPLLQDIYDSTRLLADKMNTSQLYSDKIRATATSSISYHNPWAGNYEVKVVAFKTHTKLVAVYELESAARQLLAQTGITNPALLVWELMPYSFVIDWFVPVGTYLESLTAFDGFDLVTSKSYVVTKERGWSFRDYKAGPTREGRWTNYTEGNALLEDFRYTRAGMAFWPSYTLKTKSPIGGEPLKRLATATALLRVLFK